MQDLLTSLSFAHKIVESSFKILLLPVVSHIYPINNSPVTCPISQKSVSQNIIL